VGNGFLLPTIHVKNIMKSNTSIIKTYFQAISQANTEAAKKELFQTLLTRLFDHDIEAATIIERLNLGAEKTIFNIPLKNRLKTGRADTQYNNVIIEWGKNRAKTGEQAKEQLTEYCLGNWHSGQLYHNPLISTNQKEKRHDKIYRTYLRCIVHFNRSSSKLGGRIAYHCFIFGECSTRFGESPEYT
jgi:hypothetical protein